jgi:hypothetical protein
MMLAPPPPLLAILEPTLVSPYTYVTDKKAKDDVGTSGILLIFYKHSSEQECGPWRLIALETYFSPVAMLKDDCTRRCHV